MSQTLVIRADASARIGTGHMMRCLALAQNWRRSGERYIFVSAETTPALQKRLATEGFQSVLITAAPGTAQDVAETAEIAKTRNASWVVADSYQFGVDYQRGIRAAGIRLLFIDDYGHAGEYTADLVLNQNLFPKAALYARRDPHTRLLLGPQYALLREEFLRWSDWQREIPAVARKVLVTWEGVIPTMSLRKLSKRCTASTWKCELFSVAATRHFNDQAARYATGELRTCVLTRINSKGHTERRYRPGQ